MRSGASERLRVDMRLGVIVTLVTTAWCLFGSSPRAQADMDVSRSGSA